VALTAYAMPADRIKCIDAGMDDYISKPLHVDDVVSAIGRALGERARVGTASPWSGAEAAFDPTALSQFDGMMDGGEPVVSQFLRIFEREEPARFRSLQEAVRARSASAVARDAHSMGGTCGTLGGREVRSRALAIEQAALAEQWDLVEPQVRSLEAALERLRVDLRHFAAARLG
jgi:protein-histidine pros-kinase